MKLAYVVSHYPTANHTYILREIRQLRSCGFEIDVVAISGDTRPPSALTDEERDERARTYVVKRAGARAIAAAHLAVLARRPAAYARGLWFAVRLGRADARAVAYNLVYFAEAVVAGRVLEQRGFERVHTHYATNVAVIAARIFPFRLSATIHGSAEFIDPEAHRLREKVAACSFVCAISQFGRSQLMRATSPAEWHKFELTPLGVAHPPAGVGREPAEAASRAGRSFELACVGQLQPAKGHHVLLDAVAALVAGGRDVRLVLVGDGPDRGALAAHVERLGLGGRVDFAGALNQHDVARVYASADAVVLASFAEGVPVVLMEAMSAGVPCVATRITGIPELIRDGVDGLLVTPSSVEELADAIARLIDAPALCTALAHSARQRVREHYDLSTNVARLAEVFRRRHAAPPAPTG